MLSRVTHMAGLVTVPRPEQLSLRQVEFLPLSGKRVLAILVVNDREVQNRVIHTDREYDDTELHAGGELHQPRVRRPVAVGDPYGRARQHAE